MSEQFKVGEVVILQNSINFPQLNGEEAEITEGLAVRKIVCGGQVISVACYKVHLLGKPAPSGEWELFPMPHQLRRRKPPRREIDTVVSWSDCAWKPMHVKLAICIEQAKQGIA